MKNESVITKNSIVNKIDKKKSGYTMSTLEKLLEQVPINALKKKMEYMEILKHCSFQHLLKTIYDESIMEFDGSFF